MSDILIKERNIDKSMFDTRVISDPLMFDIVASSAGTGMKD
jgi:hypothetical protein